MELHVFLFLRLPNAGLCLHCSAFVSTLRKLNLLRKLTLKNMESVCMLVASWRTTAPFSLSLSCQVLLLYDRYRWKITRALWATGRAKIKPEPLTDRLATREESRAFDEIQNHASGVAQDLRYVSLVARLKPPRSTYLERLLDILEFSPEMICHL